MSSVVFADATGMIQRQFNRIEVNNWPVSEAFYFPDGTPAGWSMASSADDYVDPELYYVSGGSVALRPALAVTIDTTTITADGADSATLNGLPAPSLVSVYDANGLSEYEVVDGVFVVTAAVAQVVTVQIHAPPSAVYTVEITAT